MDRPDVADVRNTDPHTDLGQICPCGNALSRDGVWIAFAVLEGSLELAELDAGEVTALSSNIARATLRSHRPPACLPVCRPLQYLPSSTQRPDH